jgi:hypothetical protein
VSADPHQQSVYGWEESWPGWDKNHIGFNDCRRLVYLACDAYRVARPTIVQHPQRTFSWSMPRHNRISIQGGERHATGGRNVATAMHEAAHHIAWHRHGERIQDHGPTFLGIYLDLLTRAKVAPRVALEASARSAGLRWRSKSA